MKKLFLIISLFILSVFVVSASLHAVVQNNKPTPAPTDIVAIPTPMAPPSMDVCPCPLNMPSCFAPNGEYVATKVVSTIKIPCNGRFKSCPVYGCAKAKTVPLPNPAEPDCVCPVGMPNCAPLGMQAAVVRQEKISCGNGFKSCPVYACVQKK